MLYRGDEKSPLFVPKMFEKQVHQAIEVALSERQDLFLIDLSISEGNAISVTIDGDKGVSVNDCVFISRAIEGSLDREESDFSLEVSSAGATSPLLKARQYKKHIGRALEVKTVDNEKYVANLMKADEEAITLNWKTREPKPVGKGKMTVEKKAVLKYNEIEQAKVKIKF